MKRLKLVLIVLVVLLVTLVGVGTVLPTTYEVERSIVVDAPPEAVHEWVGHLEKWPEWTTWNDGDPSMKTTLGALTTGVGASQSWTGRSGDGELELTKCDASGIAYGITFIEGDRRYPAKASISYSPVGTGSTNIT